MAEQTLDQLLHQGFTLDVARWPDAPLRPGDRVLYVQPEPTRVLIARAPLLTGPGRADTLTTDYQPALAKGLRT